jgi:hypothetical protein
MNRSLFYYTVLVILVLTLSEIMVFSIPSAITQMDKSQKYIKPIPLYNTTNHWFPYTFQFNIII